MAMLRRGEGVPLGSGRVVTGQLRTTDEKEFAKSDREQVFNEGSGRTLATLR